MKFREAELNTHHRHKIFLFKKRLELCEDKKTSVSLVKNKTKNRNSSLYLLLLINYNVYYIKSNSVSI